MTLVLLVKNKANLRPSFERLVRQERRLLPKRSKMSHSWLARVNATQVKTPTTKDCIQGIQCCA